MFLIIDELVVLAQLAFCDELAFLQSLSNSAKKFPNRSLPLVSEA
jgi:hypothetical protein